MNSSSELEPVQTTLSRILTNATEPVYLLRPASTLLEILIEVATETESPPIHVLATESELKPIQNRFPSATHAADLVDEDRLTLTPTVPDGWGAAIVTEQTAHALVKIDDHQLVFETDEVPDGLLDTCEEYRDVSQHFDLRTPAWSQVTETLTDTLGPEARDDFSKAIEVLARLEEPVIDEVLVSLLIAARHELLLYDLSSWAEDIRFCSKASLSRAKGALEDEGVLESEKVPIDVGRPRLRLTLTDEYSSLSVSELLREVNTIKGD